MGKKKFVAQQFGPEGIHTMAALKQALDPLNIMNPHKVFDAQERGPWSSESDQLKKLLFFFFLSFIFFFFSQQNQQDRHGENCTFGKQERRKKKKRRGFDLSPL